MHNDLKDKIEKNIHNISHIHWTCPNLIIYELDGCRKEK